MAKTVFQALMQVPSVFLNKIFNHRHDGVNADGSAPIDYAADTGGADAYVIALSPALTARVVGMPIHFMAANANTGPSTLNDGLGAVDISNNFDQPLAAGAIKAGQIVTVAWDGVDYQMISSNGAALLFSVHKNGIVQAAVVSNTWTKLTWSVEEEDSNGNFAADKFTPTIAGVYIFYASAIVMSMPDTSQASIAIFKNGSLVRAGEVISPVINAPLNANVTAELSANGTIDYFEAYITQNSGVNKDVDGNKVKTYFHGYKIN